MHNYFPVSLVNLYDILGIKILELVGEEKRTGGYEIEFNATSLSSGVYFYQLKTEGFVETKKMLLLK